MAYLVLMSSWGDFGCKNTKRVGCGKGKIWLAQKDDTFEPQRANILKTWEKGCGWAFF
jgi:hypothetical protein